MKMFCLLGLHRWKANGVWAGRKCQFCHQVEVLYYDKDAGEQWVRVA